MTRDAVRCTGVEVTIGSAGIVKGVDLCVPRGGWLSVIGPNGAGKTTLLRALVGQVSARGDIALDGRPVQELSRRERARSLALVAQDPVVPFGMTVADYALLGRTPHLGPFAFDGPSDRARVTEVLERLDLAPLADRELASLSGGERQRTFIARALVQAAPILLLDEPTTALDIGHQQDVLELIDELRRVDDLTVISTLHDLTVAGCYADQLVMMDDGVVVASGPPSEVLTEELIRKYYRAEVTIIEDAAGPIVVPRLRGVTG